MWRLLVMKSKTSNIQDSKKIRGLSKQSAYLKAKVRASITKLNLLLGRFSERILNKYEMYNM